MRVLVDTSAWREHLRIGEPKLVELLEKAEVLAHSAIVGELACGNRKKSRADFSRAPRAAFRHTI